MTRLKVTTIGESVAVLLPPELLARLRVAEGDTLFAVETQNGVELTSGDPELARQLEVMDGVLHDYQDSLRQLAG